MKVKELRKAIAEIGGAQEASTTALVEGLAELDRLFEDCDDELVENFLERLRAVSGPSADVDRSIVDEYVARLNEAGQRRDLFEPLFSTLLKDPLVRKTEANAIQHGYIGGRREWPTKREALAAIEKWFQSRRFEEAVLEDIKKSTPW